MNRKLEEELLELMKYAICPCCAEKVKIDEYLPDKEFSDEVFSLFRKLNNQSHEMDKKIANDEE